MNATNIVLMIGVVILAIGAIVYYLHSKKEKEKENE